eukprot:4318555-Amphidinium_carterae.1
MEGNGTIETTPRKARAYGAHSSPCSKGAQEYLEGLGLDLTHADIFRDGIDGGSDDAVTQYVAGERLRVHSCYHC